MDRKNTWRVARKLNCNEWNRTRNELARTLTALGCFWVSKLNNGQETLWCHREAKNTITSSLHTVGFLQRKLSKLLNYDSKQVLWGHTDFLMPNYYRLWASLIIPAKLEHLFFNVIFSKLCATFKSRTFGVTYIFCKVEQSTKSNGLTFLTPAALREKLKQRDIVRKHSWI